MGEIEKHKIGTWITDTTNGFESEEADTKWLLEEFVPSMISSSIEKILIITDCVGYPYNHSEKQKLINYEANYHDNEIHLIVQQERAFHYIF